MKKKEEEKDIEQAKKDFIKEQIKEDKKKERFKIFRRIGLTLLLALFFGAVAGTTIYVMDNFLKVRIPFLSEVEDEPINTIDIQNTQPTQATDEQRVSENIDLTDKAALDNYKAASIKYAQIGEMCNDFLVSVVYSKSKSDWFNESISSDEESVGIIFSSDDNNYYIATYDLDSNDSDISIKLNNSNKYSAKIVETGRDDKSAVLSVAKKDISKDDLETIKVAEFADSDTIEIGLPVIAIGKPDGVMHSVMLGKITNDNISTQIVDNELNFFNTDIISDENSEGLVVNESGAVLGIISSDYEEVTGSSHISFIAINDLKSDIQRAANGEKELYLGVTGININKDAGTELGVDSGVYITRVEANSPALSAGLRVTDIITDINKESDITMKKLHEILNSAKSGDKLKLKVLRGGKDKKEIEVVVK